MTPDAQDPALRSSLEFEILTAELLAHFVEVPSGEVDDAILGSQQRICGLLGLDLSTLWQWEPANPRQLFLTHLYWPGKDVPVPEKVDAEEMFPWTQRELAAGRILAFRSHDEYPPEAARDLQSLRQLGIRSSLRFPLSTGGGPVLGALTFATTGAEREWAPDVVRRLRLVAQIFAGALGRKRAEWELLASEERLQLSAESAGVGLWELDLSTATYWATSQARRHFAAPGDEVLTLARVLSAVVPADRGRIVEAVNRAIGSGAEATVEYRVVGPDGEERWLQSKGRVRRGPTGEAASILGVTLDVTERRRAEAALRELSQRLIQAHEEERALLARDLHDDLTQRLAVLAIDVGRAEMAAPGGSHGETLRRVREGLVGLSEDVHSLAYQLHPSVLEELGLGEALRTECERFRRQGRAELTVALEPERVAIGGDAELCLFRVAQEALRNVERHSGAGAVSVSLRQRDGGLQLSVRDDGVGFDPAEQRGRRSLGLSSMRERVGLVGGTLRVESAPGEGTAVVAWVGARGGSE